ncbi:MAG: ABC transporter ATP-binding protein [Verrucomicrobium sp.]
MSAAIITVENLGKKYQVSKTVSQPRYTALRDVVSSYLQRLFSGASTDGIVDSHEDFWALRDVSFEVQAGEIVGIVGRNGAGKSTLLKILSRITQPSAGRVTLQGRIASLLEVGTGFHPELTGRENIYLNGAILGMSRIEIRGRFDEIVAFAEVEKFLDTPVKHYSSGMYVRLAFAIAAHLDPEILVIDEVLAVGDAAFQSKCLQRINTVSKEGRTILFVSHNMAAVRSLCTRIVLLDHGQLQFDGPVSDGLSRYASTVTGSVTPEWQRPGSPPQPQAGFIFASCHLSGVQPHLVLHIRTRIAVATSHPPFFLAVDITDAATVPVMQALPAPSPFISGASGDQQVDLEIDLPPLVPGSYLIDLWLGTHFTSTSDHVRGALAFQVTSTPSSGRTFPHTGDHGWIVPPCRHTVTAISTPS